MDDAGELGSREGLFPGLQHRMQSLLFHKETLHTGAGCRRATGNAHVTHKNDIVGCKKLGETLMHSIFFFLWFMSMGWLLNPKCACDLMFICRMQRWAGSGRWSMCFSKLFDLSSVPRNTSVKMAAFSRSPACLTSTKCLKDAEVQHFFILCNSFNYQKFYWSADNSKMAKTTIQMVCHVISDVQLTLKQGFIDVCTEDE